jgi:hypothetical protein
MYYPYCLTHCIIKDLTCVHIIRQHRAKGQRQFHRNPTSHMQRGICSMPPFIQLMHQYAFVDCRVFTRRSDALVSLEPSELLLLELRRMSWIRLACIVFVVEL